MNGKQTGKETISIVTAIEQMSAIKVADRIGKRVYEAIRKKEQNPMFIKLLAGHEGWSTGNMITGARRKKTRKFWSKQTISELAQRIRPGVPVYTSHQNPGPARQKAGVIKAAWRTQENGIEGAAAIAHITDSGTKDDIRQGRIDTCSIEAQIVCSRDKGMENDSWLVSAINKVTGIALGSKAQNKPGFPRASVLAMVEEFESDDQPPPDTAEQEGEDSGSTQQQQTSGPSELFTRERLEKDPLVEEIIKTRIDAETKKLEKLHELVSGGFIPSPPEREDQEPRNPLIPRPGKRPDRR